MGKVRTLLDLESYGCHQDAHERTDPVEEAEWQVGQGGDSQNGGLCHSASVPRNQYGGYCDGIFDGPAQQVAFISLFPVNVSEHISRKDDADVLVGCSQIEEQSGEGC